LKKLDQFYFDYVDTYRVNGELPLMMELKRIHTMNVVENARSIVAGEQFTEQVARVCVAAALLHDTGRYEQLKRYNTFRDSDSVDHAVFSHDIVKEQGWLEADPSWTPSERQAILDAVLYHNRRDLPEGLDPVTLAASHTVRDADKLDIFRVLEDRVQHSDWRHDGRVFWNLSTTAGISPAVADAICSGGPVDYQNIKSLADFVMVEVGWMVSGLAYATTRKLCLERGHLDFQRNFLHQLTKNPIVDEICALAEAKLRGK